MLQTILRSAVFCCATPVVLFSPGLSASPVISELYYDASGPDSGLVFVELYGTPGTVLDSYRLEGINGTGGTVYSSVALSGVIPADGVFVIGDDDAGTTLVANADMIASIDYQNGPDSVVLRDDTAIFDAVGYGVFGASDIFAGEGSPAPDPVSGSSIARLNPALDSNDNSADFSVLDTPTPGSVPAQVSAVPVPAAAYLFGSGLLGLATVARRVPTRSRRRRACAG